jgi:Ni/Co efflux regulator RcnB
LEERMKKVSAMILVALFAVIGLAVRPAAAQDKKEMTAGATKEARWHGQIVRSDKDNSTLTVRRRGQSYERVIHYDSATKWTMGTKTIEMSDVKDGDEVICLGSYNDKKEFIAARIDKRGQKLP